MSICLTPWLEFLNTSVVMHVTCTSPLVSNCNFTVGESSLYTSFDRHFSLKEKGRSEIRGKNILQWCN